MSRTTLNIDDPLLEELKKLQRQLKKPLGRIVSDLLAHSLAEERGSHDERHFHWHTRPGKPLVDLEDKDALFALLDEPGE